MMYVKNEGETPARKLVTESGELLACARADVLMKKFATQCARLEVPGAVTSTTRSGTGWDRPAAAAGWPRELSEMTLPKGRDECIESLFRCPQSLA